MAQAGSGRRLGGAEIALIVVVGLLVVTFLVMLALRFLPGDSDAGAQAPTSGATQEGDDGASAGEDGGTGEEPEEGPGEDLSELDYSFVTPSGNIGCAMAPNRVVCGIASFEYSVPGDLAEACTGTVGHFLAVRDESAELLCDTSGSTPAFDTDQTQVLDYGEELERGAFRCLSEQTGLTCSHTGTGRSITVARAAYSLG